MTDFKADTFRPQASRPVGRNRASLAALDVLGVTLVLVLIAAIRSPQKDDVAWLLYVAHRWLHGKQLYVDLVEVNPPLIVWIYAVPVWLADLFGVRLRMIAEPFFALAMLASAWSCAVLLHGRHPLFTRRAPVFGVLGTVLLALPGVEFGQREHLLSAAVLPYLCLYAVEWDARGRDTVVINRPSALISAIVGAVAGLGCALKPTYAVAFFTLELVGVWLGGRLFRAASVSGGTAALLYATGVLLFCPAFLEKAVPLALALYGATDTPCWMMLFAGRVVLAGEVAAVLLFVLWPPPPGLARTALATLLLFAVGAFVAYVLQGKNWFYHQLPATVVIVFALLLWSATRLRDALRERRFVPGAPALLACSAILLFAQSGVTRVRPWIETAVNPDFSTEVRLEQMLRHEHARSYIAFSEWIALGFPVVNTTGVRWASRFDSMWALKGAKWRASQDGTVPQDWPIANWIATDFVAACPDIAVVDRRGRTDWVAILTASSPSFSRAWTTYRQLASFNGLVVFKRAGSTCSPAITIVANSATMSP